MVEFGLGLAAADVLWTALAIGGYALAVNGLYQRLSKRVMFASKSQTHAEAELHEAMEIVAAAAEELDGADELPISEQRELVVAANEEASDALDVAEGVLQRNTTRRRSVRYWVLAPLVIVGFFLLLSMVMVFLTNGDRPVGEVLGLSLAVVLAVRVTAYLSEPTSHDIAKMLPLALLGFFLVDGGLSNASGGLSELLNLRNHLPRVAAFLVVIVAFEFALHVLDDALRFVWRRRWLQNAADSTKRL